MKSGHAAALALVYLMVPPKLPGKHLTFDAQAKLSKWYFAGIYDSMTECEANRKDHDESALRAVAHNEVHDRDRKVRELAHYLAQEKCVAEGDPQLEGNALHFGVLYPLVKRPTKP
ncbi:MAG TPA: hypothetical protein VEU51_18505 [Candidatus Acidoferrales bacterium]|nr:hypothetical protein [Candidatus Acidoferrales bacterium]